jgi:predicted phage terminase large subunit-like protein
MTTTSPKTAETSATTRWATANHRRRLISTPVQARSSVRHQPRVPAGRRKGGTPLTEEQLRISRLIINLPPRALKSTLASVLLAAWYLGRYPEKRILCASYNDRLASQFSRDFRRVIEDPLFREAFARFKPGSKSTETEIFTSLNGYRIATSVGGTVTGRGANLIIVDDPINASDISSEAERNRVKEWFDKVVQSRLDRQGEDHILVVMQRLHEDDLTGHLLAKDSGWKHVCLPIRNTGPDRLVPLGRGAVHCWPSGADLMPKAMDRAVQDRFKGEIGERAFSAQFLQEPLPAGGAVFRLDWIGSYQAPPCRDDCIAIVQSWDVAVKPGEASDYSVCTTWAVTRGNVYHLLDVKRVRLPYYEVLALARQLIAQYRPAHVLVEDAANGAALAQELARSSQHTTIPISPRLDKLSRAQGATPAFESGRVLLPGTADWRHSYLHELTGFPATRHDDQVDSTSQFINWAEDRFRLYNLNPMPGGPLNEDPWLP